MIMPFKVVYLHEKRMTLTFTTLWVNSAHDKLMILLLLLLFFPENRFLHFMKSASIGDSLHEISNLGSWENVRKKSPAEIFTQCAKREIEMLSCVSDAVVWVFDRESVSKHIW